MTGQIEDLIRYAQERQADRAVAPERIRAALPARRRRHVRQHRLGMIAAVAAVTAVVTVPVLVLGGRGDGSTEPLPGAPKQPLLRYTGYVYLKDEATADQKAAIKAALVSFNPMGAVRFETRDEAWRKLQDSAKDRPDLLQGVNAENIPESFQFEPEDLMRDCTGYAKVTRMPGVQVVQVVQRPEDGPGGVNSDRVVIRCDGEYAGP